MNPALAHVMARASTAANDARFGMNRATVTNRPNSEISPAHSTRDCGGDWRNSRSLSFPTIGSASSDGTTASEPTIPRSKALSPNVSSMKMLRKMGTLNRPKPSAPMPMSMKRNVRIFERRANAMDVDIGTGLCSTSMVSPSTAICSLAPRAGSRRVPTNSANPTAGTPTATKAQRQPSIPPARPAMPPTVTGPTSWPMGRPRP